MQVPDFVHSYFRFYLDFEGKQASSLSHKPPTRTNRVRITLESICRLTHRPSGRTTNYALTAACRTERVGASRNELWLMPSANVFFIVSDNSQVAIYKSWHKNDPGVMLHPPSLGPQPERQFFRSGENFQEVSLTIATAGATALDTFDSAAQGILGTQPIVSRIEYIDGQYDVRIDQPVKTINLAERDELHQIDTGPIIVPDLSAERLAATKEDNNPEIAVFDLAYAAWHEPTWAEFVIEQPTEIAEGVSVNHYSRARHVEPARNVLLAVDV